MPIEILIVLFLGLSFGSFITMAAYRLPRGEDMVFKPSRCTACQKRLSFADLWPVLSWAWNKGACRHCGAKVSPRYPLIEIATAAGFLILYFKFGITIPALLLALMWVTLMVMIVIDLEHYIIPDSIHFILAPLGIIYHIVINTKPEQLVLGFATGAVLGLSLHYGYRFIRRKEGLGFGDVKFLAVAGIWLGPQMMVPFIFYAGVLGLITGLIWRLLKKGPIFPFGPALAISLFLCMVSYDMVKLFWNIGYSLQ